MSALSREEYEAGDLRLVKETIEEAHSWRKLGGTLFAEVQATGRIPSAEELLARFANRETLSPEERAESRRLSMQVTDELRKLYPWERLAPLFAERARKRAEKFAQWDAEAKKK